MIDNIELKNAIKDVYEQVAVPVRRQLHAYPELSFHEEETTEYLINQFPKGWMITRFRNSTGFVADFVVDANRPTLVFRADIDALPIHENTKLSYSSTKEGVMHSCGHDMHAAILLATACIINSPDFRYIPAFNIRFLFQPAEEVLPGGAKCFIDNGVLNGINPMAAFALHLSPELKTGQIGIFDGPFMASSDEMYVKVIGKGGHAAIAEHNIDPIIVASRLVLKIKEISDMELSGNPHVAVIGDFIADGATNITPDYVTMQGTIRTFNDGDRTFIKTKIQEIADELQSQYNCVIELNIIDGYPTLFNNHGVVEKVKTISSMMLDSQDIVSIPRRMTSDDFAYYSNIIPSCMIRLGCGSYGSGKLHSPSFNPNEECMKTGIELLSNICFYY